jgi:hypothetical protein
MHYVALPFFIIGTFFKITNSRIQKKINSSNNHLQLQGTSINELEQEFKERKITKIYR